MGDDDDGSCLPRLPTLRRTSQTGGRVKGTRMRAVVSVVAGLGIVAAACGGDDSSNSSAAASSSTANATSSTASGGTSTTAAAAAQPTSMEGWEALWAKERDAIVARAKSEKLGKSADGK